MAITRDHIFKIVEDFKAKPPSVCQRDYKSTLCYQLTTYHLSNETSCRQRIREEHGGNHIGIHKRDLELYQQGEEAKRRGIETFENKNRSRIQADLDEEYTAAKPRSAKRTR